MLVRKLTLTYCTPRWKVMLNLWRPLSLRGIQHSVDTFRVWGAFDGYG